MAEITLRSYRSLSKAGLFTSCVLFLLLGARVGAVNVTVCASGCTYNNTQLQTALDAANPGDEVLLQENFLYSGQFLMKVKSCPGQTDACYVTLRTGVTSTGSVISAATFPPTNIRMTPALALNKLAILRSTSATVAALRTDTVSPPPKYWRVKWIQFDSFEGGSGVGSLVSLGTGAITVLADVPGRYQFIQNYFRGSPVQGQHRGLSIWAANDVTVRDNYFKDIKTFGSSDGQVVNVMVGNNITITNNYMEGGTETFIAGGGGTCCMQSATVNASPTPTTTGATLSTVTDLQIGQWFSIVDGGVEFWTQVQTIVGNAVTWSPALDTAPDSPGDVEWNPIPTNLTFTKNYMTRPVSWRNPVVGTPQNVSVSAALAGGSLAAGSYHYKVVARHPTQTGTAHRSTASAEASCVIASGTTGKCTITWSAVTNATVYYIYGRSSGGQNIRWSVTAPTVTYVDTGTSGTAENVPTTAGTRWSVKNTFEFKTWVGALIEGNIIENSWLDAQIGPLVLFTPSAQASTADSAALRDVIFRNNIIRHGFQAMQLRCRYNDTGPSANWTISNNLFYDINTSWGSGTAHLFLWGVSDDGWPVAGGEPGCHGDNFFEHNTLDGAGTFADFLYLDMINSGVDRHISNLKYRSNIFQKGTYGLFGISCAIGNDCWVTYTDTDRIFNKNLIADGNCSGTALPDPANQFCPTYATLLTNWVSPSTGNYRLTAASVYNNAGHDATDVGANIDTIEALTNIAISGDDSGSPPPPPPTITTVSLPGGLLQTAYSSTLTATGGTTPYTWAISVGTLPTGLSLSSSTGAITGTPSVEGQSDFTVSVTGAGQTSTKNLSINITLPVGPTDRPRKFATYMEAITFRRETEPGEADFAEVGDIWFDQTTSTLKVCVQTAPIYIWEQVGNVGAGAEMLNITLRADGAVYTMTDLTSTEINSSRHHRARADLTDYDECRIVVKVTTAGVTGVVRWTYDTDNLGEDTTYTEVAGSDASLSALGLIAGAWTAIPAPAKTDVFLGNRVSGGNGTEDPQVSNVYLQCRKVP